MRVRLRMPRILRSFRARLTLALWVLTLTPLVLASTFLEQTVSNRLKAAGRDRLTAAAEQVQKEMSRSMRQVQRDLVSLRQDSLEMERLALYMRSSGRPLVSWARGVMSRHGLDHLSLVDSDGRVLSSGHWMANYGQVSGDLAPQPEQNPRTRYRLIPTARGLKPSFTTELPLSRREPRYWLVGGHYLDSAWLDDLARLTDTVLVLEAKGEVELLTAPEEGKEVTGLRTRELRDGDKMLLDDLEFRVRTIQLTDDTRLLVGVDQRELIEILEFLRVMMFLALGLSVIGAWLASVLLSQRLSRPVAALSEAAEAVAAGDMLLNVPGEGDDEMGRLVRRFNEMVARLKESRERLVKAERLAAWREVARRIAHEVKNPLFPIQLAMENMRRTFHNRPDRFPEIFHEGTEAVLEEVEGLRRMVTEFSDFARMPAPELEPHELRDIVQHAVQLYSGTREGVDLKVLIDAGPGEDVINADRDMLARVVTNLVSNAINALPEGGGLITVRIAREAGEVRLEISDTGSGMDDEVRSKLFEPYFTTREQGTGLGLAIVQRIVTDHGGIIDVASTPGEGSTFSVLLPALPRR